MKECTVFLAKVPIRLKSIDIAYFIISMHQEIKSFWRMLF